LEIRKIIYTTNAIESLNSSIRKYTKTKSVFPDDQSAMKAVYLAINIIQQKWVLRHFWGRYNAIIMDFLTSTATQSAFDRLD